MRLTSFFLPLFVGLFAFGNPLESKYVLDKLSSLEMRSEHPTVFNHKSEISVTLPGEKPRGNEKQEWIFSNVNAFVKDGTMVHQIYIKTENCKVTEAQLDKALMQERIKELVKTISSQLFGQPFELDGSRYFKELGPNWHEIVRVKVKEPHPGVRAMRISRGMSKCDSRGGYFFRYDFFL